MKRIKKKKAFIGAIISGIGALAGTIGNAVKSKKQAKAQTEQLAADQAFAKEQAELNRQAEREQFEAQQSALREQRRLEQELADKQWQQAQTQANQQAAIQQAQAMTEEAQNQEYVDVMKSRVTFKCGGKFKDRNNKSKTKAKKKAGLGADWKAQSSLAKAGDVIGGVGSAIGGVGNLITSLISKPAPVVKQEAIKPQVFKPEVLAPVEHKQVVQGETYQAAKKKVIKQAYPVNNMTTTTPLAKLGKKVKYKSINRFK